MSDPQWWLRPLRVLIGYAVVMAVAVAWYRIEARRERIALPNGGPVEIEFMELEFYLGVVPLVLATFLIHLTAISCTARQFTISLGVAFPCGLLGVGLLILAIVTSPDKEAEMAVILIPIAFLAAAVTWFIATAVTLVITRRHRTP